MSKKPQRRQRRHGDLPAGFVWRDGRPRWEPSPARRAQGWRGVDLKDQWGKFLARGAAIERATEIAEAAAGLVQGRAAPPAFAAFAPAGSTIAAEGPAPAKRMDPHSIGALLTAYQASPKFTRLGEATQKDYRNKLGRFLEVIGGSTPAKLAKVRALHIDVLLPPPPKVQGPFFIEDAYDTLRDTAGVAMASGVLACVSAWLGWCVKKRRVWPTNPCGLVERETPGGRIVVYEFAEIVALVREADRRGLPSIGDAIILALDLSWSQQDVLAIVNGQVSADFHVKHRRIKTGNAGNPPLLAIGRARVEAIRARSAVVALPGRPLIVCEATGVAWKADHFRHVFAEIREATAAEMPDVAGRQFRDLRDTSITYCTDAGLTLEETCSRSLHNPSRAQQVIEKHYGAIRQGVADAGAVKLDEHFRKLGYRF